VWPPLPSLLSFLLSSLLSFLLLLLLLREFLLLWLVSCGATKGHNDYLSISLIVFIYL
jgi:hypothetical protein